MAISKTQNERPAIIELIDVSNTFEEEVAELGESLSNEIETRAEEYQALSNQIATETTARESADSALKTTIENEANTRADAVTGLTNELSLEIQTRVGAISSLQTIIGDNFNETDTVSDFENSANAAIDNLKTFANSMASSFRIGAGVAASVQGNDSYDGTVTYSRPYPEDSISVVFPAFISFVDQTDLEIKISACNHQGFSYTVTNSGVTSKHFMIGYFALGFTD